MLVVLMLSFSSSEWCYQDYPTAMALIVTHPLKMIQENTHCPVPQCGSLWTPSEICLELIHRSLLRKKLVVPVGTPTACFCEEVMWSCP